MTLLHEQFLNILRAALAGEAAACADDLTDGDWEAMMQLAAEHKLQPLVVSIHL